MNIPVDLRTLRAVRVLRPLKLVSGIPSKYSAYQSPAEILISYSIIIPLSVLYYNVLFPEAIRH